MTPSARPVAGAFAVAALFLLVYALLGTRQYTAVDGALRCLDVYRRPELSFSGNNHLLYPADVLAWNRLLGLVVGRAADPFAFLRRTQLMNATAAAAVLALLYWIVRTTTGSAGIALGATAGLGLARAFLLHATNSAEPMVGVWWAVAAVAAGLLARRHRSTWAAAAAGVALALALASYASMLLAAPAVLVLVGRGEGTRGRLAALVGSAAAVTAAVFGVAYAHAGATGPLEMIRRFLALPGASVWAGVSPARAARIPLGFVQSVLPVLPPGYAGVRSLAHAAPLRIAWLLVASVGIAALVGALVRGAWLARPRIESGVRATSTAALAGLAGALIAPLAWDPLYPKLWLLPTAFAFLAGGLLATAAGGRARRAVMGAALVLIAVEAAVNLAWALPAHRRESPYLEPARAVARAVTPEDLVVLDWDPVSEMYAGLWGADASLLTFPTEAVLRGSAAVIALDSAVAATRRRGGAVYFLGVLDETPASWDAFLGERTHLPYASVSRYRDSAAVSLQLHAGAGPALTLRRLATPGPGRAQ